jgi:hypothetical protein
MSRLEELELSYQVVVQKDRRFRLVLRWQNDDASDRTVAEGMTEAAANELRDKLTLGGLINVDIRRIQDHGAKEYRDDPQRGIIY